MQSFRFGPGYADFTYRVTEAGTVDYDLAFDTFLAGRGSDTLKLKACRSRSTPPR